MSHKVSFLDVMAAPVRQAIRAAAPAEFEITFAESGAPDAQMALMPHAEFIVAGFQPVTSAMIAAAPRLKMIQKWGIGYDKIDLDAARERGMVVAITSGANAGPVAEHAIALMLAVYRRLPLVDRKTREGVWLKSEMRSVCYQIAGKTVGLVGFGNIARMVARRLRGFDADILYTARRPADAEIERALGVRHVPMDELLARSDIVSLHVPLTDATRTLIDAAALSRMKAGAILINTARGGVVDEAALHDALVSGKLHGAGLDVFAHEPVAAGNPLLALDQVVVSPHSGGAVFDNVGYVAARAFGNLGRFLRNQSIPPEDLIVAPLPASHAS
ncbi:MULTISPECIES: 2-hydroxyacid dehydrogenase [unclassified Achromobacter]|uniref:2-hydroxyacid dehydrogenase n=1 Tax=unclassified Achromobacter TaxID=2626865 RepID=UPI000B51A224|nr:MULTISPECIES: 2-hydroxyacid dehydrogenase [unclassified Achromobacter]OWT76954.1 dehydrogenase [Achromobacter sp. HZ28]OWT77834.1 dehydrogenase [Achromobacter sp. HZ34]